MKSTLLAVRDFHFIGYVRKGYPEEKAYKNARESVIAWLLSWYLAMLIAIVGIAHHLGIRLIPKLERNVPNDTLVGLLILVLYVPIMWKLTKCLNDTPVDKTVSYKRLSWIAIGVFLSGLVMVFLILTILSIF